MSGDPIQPIVGGPFDAWHWQIDAIAATYNLWNIDIDPDSPLHHRHFIDAVSDSTEFRVCVRESKWDGRQFDDSGETLEDACRAVAERICARRDKEIATPDPPGVLRTKKYDVSIGETDTPNDLWPHILAAAEQTLRRLPNPNRENG